MFITPSSSALLHLEALDSPWAAKSSLSRRCVLVFVCVCACVCVCNHVCACVYVFMCVHACVFLRYLMKDTGAVCNCACCVLLSCKSKSTQCVCACVYRHTHHVSRAGQNHTFMVFIRYFSRGGRRRPEKGVLLKCELSMGAPAGNNQAQYPGSTCCW
jgi:hypothetical protein